MDVREPQDAMEFFNGVVDCIDEGLKTMGHEKIVSKVLGGSLADQKICKGCPHRYAREEEFMSLCVDIRYHGHLLESLEQYVKGDLLEGDFAYFCKTCNRQVCRVFSFFDFLEKCAGCRLTLLRECVSNRCLLY